MCAFVFYVLKTWSEKYKDNWKYFNVSILISNILEASLSLNLSSQFSIWITKSNSVGFVHVACVWHTFKKKVKWQWNIRPDALPDTTKACIRSNIEQWVQYSNYFNVEWLRWYCNLDIVIQCSGLLRLLQTIYQDCDWRIIRIYNDQLWNKLIR